MTFERTDPGISYTPVTMDDGLDWLLRPVSRGWCKYESLIDGTLNLLDIAIMNDGINVLDENEMRARKAAEKS